MNKIFKIIVIVMLVFALLWSCFGIGSTDFFRTINEVYAPVVGISNVAMKVVDRIFSEPEFDDDQKVVVQRFFFEDGEQYCDVVCSLNPFAKRVLAYSTNWQVTDFVRFSLTQDFVKGLFTFKFTNSLGDVIYTSYPWNRWYTLHGKTYGDIV